MRTVSVDLKAWENHMKPCVTTYKNHPTKTSKTGATAHERCQTSKPTNTQKISQTYLNCALVLNARSSGLLCHKSTRATDNASKHQEAVEPEGKITKFETAQACFELGKYTNVYKLLNYIEIYRACQSIVR